MHDLWLFYFYHCFQKSLFMEKYFLIAAINLTTRGPLSTCLVVSVMGFLDTEFIVGSIVTTLVGLSTFLSVHHNKTASYFF